MKKIILALVLSSAFTSITNAQWMDNGLNFGGNGNTFGTIDNWPIDIFTNNIQRGQWTTGGALGGNSVVSNPPTGDGLRILPWNGSAVNSAIDIWTAQDGSGGCHIRWDQTGLIQGLNDNFEFWSQRNGFWFNTTEPIGQYLFNRNETEDGRLGTNDFWRFGLNPSNINAQRTLEVFDASGNPQFRITDDPSSANFVDFKSRPLGYLNIIPSGKRVGINMNADPTHTLDINGMLRIRNTPIAAVPQSILIGQQFGVGANSRVVNRLNFTGNPNQALLGNGTFGNIATNNGISTNPFGVVQLGVPCHVGGNPNIGGIIATQFTEDRVIANRDNNFWIASFDYETGGIGFGGQPVLPFCNTGNTVEISANSKNGQYGSANASGLRFTKLIATSPTIANGINGVDNTRVLTVDGDGDVVLVNAAGGGIGNYCGATQNSLINNYEIPLAGRDFYFSDNISGDGSVLIGDVTCGFNPPANLFVRNTGLSTTTVGIWAECTGVPNITAGFFNGSQYGVHAKLGAGGNTGMGAGIFAEGGYATSGPTIAQWAGYFNGDVTIVAGSYYPSDSLLKTNIYPIENALDIIKVIETVTFNYNNLSFPSMNLPSDLEYGVIAENIATVLPDLVKNITHPEVLDSLGNIVYQAVEYQGVNYTELIPVVIAGVKELDAQVNAIRDSIIVRDSTIRRNDSLLQDMNDRTLSDGTLKNNVTPLTNSLALIKQLNGINFKWDTLSFPWKNFETDNQIGYIAQDVNTIVPEVVFQDDSGYFHVDYQRLMPLVTEGMKQLDEKNKMLDSINQNLEDRLLALENCINEANLCGGNERTSNNENNESEGKVIELENLNAIILVQNLPNPFAEKTSISYTIPKDVVEAQLLFYDMNGRIIKQVEINERGEGKLTVYGENLQNGVYTYSLIADGKLIATKKMVKQ